MKTDFDELPSWMQGHGFSWDEIIAELSAAKPPVSTPKKNKKAGCKPRTRPEQVFPMESCGTVVFL